MPALRAMNEQDLDVVMGIETLSFPNPWSRSSFLHELRENQRAMYLVAEEDGCIVGYIGMWIILDEGHITNLAVHPAWRRRGIAHCLLDALTDLARNHGITRLTLEVRKSNLGAQLLYVKYGFANSGVRRRYYRDNNEDAIIMWKTI